MLAVTNTVAVPLSEIVMVAMRSQGAGGQNVNKVNTAIHLRFDVRASSLPELYKQRLLQLQDQRINSDGIVVIKAQQYRSQEQNRAAALMRLQQLLRRAAVVRKQRHPTKPSRAAVRNRLDNKARQGLRKKLRQRPSPQE